VDLSVHTRLVALPEALLGQTVMRELTVKSTELKTLPEWLGKLGGLEVLNVRSKSSTFRCPLQALPVLLGARLKTLELQFCTRLTRLPAWLGELMALATLKLLRCEALMVLQLSLGTLTALKTLNLEGCVALEGLLASLGALVVLTT